MALSLRADLVLAGLAVVGVASDLACVLTGHTPPAIFDSVALAGLTGAAGIALPAAANPPAAPAQPPAAPAPASDLSGPVGL